MFSTARFPVQSNTLPPHKSPRFGADKNHHRLYEPIRSPEDDRFELGRTNGSLYPPIEMPSPDLHNSSAVEQKAGTTNASSTQETEGAKQTKAPEEKKGVPSKESFVSETEDLLKSDNPAVDAERIKRRINVQTVLSIGLQSLATVGVFGSGHAWAAAFLPLVNITTSKVSAWAADKISDTMVGRALSGTFEYAKKHFSRFLSIFDTKKSGSVRFAGSNTKTQETTATHDGKLLSGTLNAIQDFTNKLNSGQRQESKPQMATQLFQNMFVSMAEYISQEGSESAKSKLETLKRIQAETQEITQELPATAKNYNDIPVATRKKLLSVVYDSMTSEMPTLVQWGEGIGQDLGIPQERLNQLKGASK